MANPTALLTKAADTLASAVTKKRDWSAGCGSVSYAPHGPSAAATSSSTRSVGSADMTIRLMGTRADRTKNTLAPYQVLGALLDVAPSELEGWAEGQLGDAVVTNALAQWEMATVPLGFGEAVSA